jgi:hypothetical protein
MRLALLPYNISRHMSLWLHSGGCQFARTVHTTVYGKDAQPSDAEASDSGEEAAEEEEEGQEEEEEGQEQEE